MAEQGRLTKHGFAMRRLLAEQRAQRADACRVRTAAGSSGGHAFVVAAPVAAPSNGAKSRRRPSSKAGRFLEITPASVVAAEARSAAWFEIVLGDGTLVRVPGRFGDEELRRLLAVLRC